MEDSPQIWDLCAVALRKLLNMVSEKSHDQKQILKKTDCLDDNLYGTPFIPMKWSRFII